MTDEHKIDTLMQSIIYRNVDPDMAFYGYQPTTIAIVDNDLIDNASELWDSMFPSKITEYTIITKLEYDVYKKHFPERFKDGNMTTCLVPVEEHLKDGISPPNPYIKMIFPDNEVFETYINDGNIIIQGAQFCPVNNDDRRIFTLHEKEVFPIGSINITVYMVRQDLSFTISNLVCMDIETGAYEFTNIYKMNHRSYIYSNIMHGMYMHKCSTSQFIDSIYNLFGKVLPMVKRVIIDLWESFQWMMLNPKIKECFFTEDAPLIEPYKKPIKSGVNIKKARQNVKYIHVDIAKHRDLNKPKRKYTKPKYQVPKKGYEYTNKNGTNVYVGPGTQYQELPPREEPIERKAT